MKKIFFITIIISAIMISCNSGESLARKHFKMIESCFRNHKLVDFEDGKVSKLDLYYCLKPLSSKINNEYEKLTPDELNNYKKEFKRLVKQSAYRIYIDAINKVKDK